MHAFKNLLAVLTILKYINKTSIHTIHKELNFNPFKAVATQSVTRILFVSVCIHYYKETQCIVYN